MCTVSYKEVVLISEVNLHTKEQLVHFVQRQSLSRRVLHRSSFTITFIDPLVLEGVECVEHGHMQYTQHKPHPRQQPY